MSLDNTFGVKRSYAALEPKTAADKYEAQVNTVKEKMETNGVQNAYKAMFENKKKLAKTLRLLSSSGLPGKKVTGPSLIVNPDNYNDAVTFATACKNQHNYIKSHLDEKRGAFRAHYINREAMSADLMNSLVKWYESLELGEGGIIAALSVFDPSVRSATEAKPEEDIKTRQQTAAEKALAEEKAIFMKGRHGGLIGELGPLKLTFLEKLKTYNKEKNEDFKIGKTLIFFINQDSSLSSDPFDLNMSAESKTVTSQVRRLAVLAQNSTKDIVIMAENDKRSDVDGPELYNQNLRNEKTSITHKVLIAGNPEIQAEKAKEEAKKAKEDAEAATLEGFKGEVPSLNSNLANKIANEVLKVVKGYNPERDLNYVLSNFKITKKIKAHAQATSAIGAGNLKTERTDPKNYYPIVIYMVQRNDENAIVPVTYNKTEQTLKAPRRLLPLAQAANYTNLSGKYLYRVDNNEPSKVAGLGKLNKTKTAVEDIK